IGEPPLTTKSPSNWELKLSVPMLPTFCGGGELLENPRCLMFMTSIVSAPVMYNWCARAGLTYCPAGGGRVCEVVTQSARAAPVGTPSNSRATKPTSQRTFIIQPLPLIRKSGTDARTLSGGTSLLIALCLWVTQTRCQGWQLRADHNAPNGAATEVTDD